VRLLRRVVGETCDLAQRGGEGDYASVAALVHVVVSETTVRQKNTLARATVAHS
jgi:hypothetical protein